MIIDEKRLAELEWRSARGSEVEELTWNELVQTCKALWKVVRATQTYFRSPPEDFEMMIGSVREVLAALDEQEKKG